MQGAKSNENSKCMLIAATTAAVAFIAVATCFSVLKQFYIFNTQWMMNVEMNSGLV